MNNGLLACALLALATHGAIAAGEPETGDLGWISGRWCGAAGGEKSEEYWTTPAGGMVLGLGRTVKDGRTSSYEYMRIVAENGVPTYVAHPDGGAAVAFRRSAGGPGWARFENLEHDFPTRVEYRRTGATLHAEIAGPGADGKEVVIPFDYTACGS